MNAQKTPQQKTSYCKAFTIYLIPILIVFIAICYKIQFLKSSFCVVNVNHFTNFVSKNIGLKSICIDEINVTQKLKSDEASYCVLWMAPFLSGGGYSSEAWSYITAIKENVNNPLFRIKIEQHGDLESIDFWEGLPEHMRKMALHLHGTECNKNETVVVCHSEPGAWYPPLFETFPCPPSSNYGDFLAVIGRTMFETDRVNEEHVKRCNKMDFVWVPTEFHVSSFINSGVELSKIVKVVQSVDVDFFNPDKYLPLDLLPIRNAILGGKNNEPGSDFVFLSIFKWEYRKGWDVLLKSYLTEFSQADSVTLYLLTNPYHTETDFGNKILEFLKNSALKRPETGWASVYVIDTHIPQVDLPRLYKSADVFVLPSRGEGWGRPLVEAMAMSLPVIATNWSGMTEYLTDLNSYPLPVDRFSEVIEGPFTGHLWAEPSVEKLQGLMRYVVNNIDEGRVKGRRAREDMITKFSPVNVSNIVNDLVNRIVQERT